MQSSGVNNIDVGERVRFWRKLKGIAQKDLAAKASINATRLCKIEKGKLDALGKEIEAIAAAMELTMPEFYGATASSSETAITSSAEPA